MSQFRFVHVGIAAALAAATVTAAGVINEVGAAGSPTASSFVPIVPCRLADTRPGADHVGVQSTPIGAGESVTFGVWGSNGTCSIPTTATGIATNVTAVGATAGSYLTVYPADASPRPTASNLNYTPTSPPTPNQVTVGLSASGAIAAFNFAGTVDVIIDIVGYYELTSAAGPGPAGPVGPQGPAGAQGQQGSQGPAGTLPGGTIVFTGLDAQYHKNGHDEDALYSATCLGLPADYSAHMPLTLPVGARITEVVVLYTGVSEGDMTVELSSADPSNPGPSEIQHAFAPLDEGANQQTMTLQQPMLAPVSPANVYYLWISTFTNLPNFCGASVTYTM